jgi:hypothetical protein
MEDLIAELKRRKANGALCADDPLLGGCAAPLRQSDIESAEAMPGFKIPVVLRRIYTEVANGGFGYAYGLLELRGGPRNANGLDSVGLYQTHAIAMRVQQLRVVRCEPVELVQYHHSSRHPPSAQCS